MNADIAKLTVPIPKEDHDKLKIMAIQQGMTLQQMIRELIEKHMLKEKKEK